MWQHGWISRDMKQIREMHASSNWLRDVILGGQDGLVNVLGVVLGVAAAGGEQRILIAAAMAATFAEAVSMAAVAYTSAQAEKDHYEKEQEREYDEVEKAPETEKAEVRDIYAAKGFSGKLLEEIVAKITEDKEVWVRIMMNEELGLEKVEMTAVVRTAVIVGVAAVVGSLVPVMPFLLLTPTTAIPVSLIVSAVVLFGVGVYKAKIYVGKPLRSGIEMAIIGMGAAGAGFLIGKLFNAV